MSASLARRLVQLALGALVACAFSALLAAGAQAEECSNGAAREQQGAQYLPECRGYELVSPVLKNGQEAELPEQFQPLEIPVFVAATDRALAYDFTGGVPGSESAGLYIPVISRTEGPASPWPYTATAPESRFGVLPGSGPRPGGEYGYYDPTLSCAVLHTRLPQGETAASSEPLLAKGETRAESEEDPEQIYVVRPPTAGNPVLTRTLVTSIKTDDPQKTTGQLGYYIDGASANCEKIAYENLAPGYQLEGAPKQSLYEWTQASGPRVASVLPDGTNATTVEKIEAGEQFMSNKGLVSQDGSKVFFTAASDGGPGETIDAGALELYVRENGTKTTEISKSDLPGTSVRDSGSVFEGATNDGGKAFFLANYGLTERTSAGTAAATTCARNARNAVIAAGTGCDLYEYDFAAGKLIDLSADLESETKDTKGANVRGVMGWSEDGNYVYFSAAGQLVPGEGKTGAENELAKEASVYAYHEGVLTYITSIDEVEAGGGAGNPRPTSEVDAGLNSAGFGSHYNQARVSPSGQFLLFNTRKTITSYDNEDVNTKEHDPEFYEYSLASHTVNCVSCRPDGKQPEMVSPFFNPQGPFLYNYGGILARTLFDDGRVFFQSSDPLVEQARRTGGVKQTVDVYQYRPLGSAGCEAATEQSSGCVNLLDSGQDDFPTYLSGASASANDVYLTTHAALAPQDLDGLRDMYDVRVGGGVYQAPAPPNCQTVEPGCQGPYVGTGIGGPHSTEALVGNGNSKAPPQVEVESFKEGKLALGRHSAKKGVLTLTVTAPGKGTIVISGAGIASARQAVAAAGSYTFKLKLGRKGRTALKHHKRVRVTVRASFAPAAGKASSIVLNVVFR